jgi:hypothetical protein
LSAEFRLAAACCIWPPSEHRNAAIRAAASGVADWNLFLRIVERQRIAGLANDGLRRAEIAAPPAVTAQLGGEAADIARQSLLLASEALRLQAAFDAAAVPALFVKGTALAQLAYGTIAIKHAWDIDLLVNPTDVRRGCDVLKAAGFVRISPPPTLADERFFIWSEFARESVFQHNGRGTFVELHWRLSDNPTLLAHVSASSGTQAVTVSAGHVLRTLRDEDLFAYLCLHGAHHGWSRLKWLADLAAWLAPKSPVEVERLYRKAKADGVGRSAAQALLLCECLFDVPLPAGLSAEMRRDRATRWLVSIALNAMAGADASRQIDDRLLGDLQIRLSQFLLAPGVRHWLRELHTQSIGWTDFQNFSLPRPLYFLYPVLRAPSWIWRRGAYLLRRSRPRVS